MMLRAGSVLVTAFLLLNLVRCSEPVAKTSAKASGAPVRKVEATRLLIRTTALPQKKSFMQSVLISGGKVRFGDEQDRYRLLDLEKKSVTVVDGVARIFSTEPFAEIRAAKLRLSKGPIPPGIEPATLTKLGNRKFGERSASGVRLAMGTWKREIWLSRELPVDPSFFALQTASEPMSETFGGVMREATPALLELEGFPIHDEAEMKAGKTRYFIQRKLEKVEKLQLPASLFEVPASYRDASPVKAPAAGRRSVSSGRNGRNTRAAGSQSSSTSRKTP